ncbi:MAG: PorP/SprF family type IX secretion system membrane protein, partial [Flavobacterium sp.]|nr:PorP/SprF family type IX secretion system membrane protein [Flavobacterium sp.]
MKLRVLFILLLLNSIISISQNTDGVMSFDVPAKNSLKFNKFLINPTFSYVREDESFINFLNKRQWSGFENAPQAYFFSYSGKFRDENGIGLGLFQRKSGLLSSFGAVANFARSVEMNRDSQFAFGVNLAYVNSGLNGDINAVDPNDPSLLNVPKNSSIAINPGVNYTTGFFDFGLTANNIFFYSFNGGVVKDDPTKGVGAHIMYTGYMDGYGIFERAKFTTLVKADVLKGKSVFSGSLLFNAPKGFWAQAGYNNVYGASAGVGLIVAKKISLGYTLEKGFGNFSTFGISHEITLAYKIKGYGEYEDAGPVVKATQKTNPAKKAVAVKKKSPTELYKERQAALALKQQQEKERLEAERLKREADIADAKAKADALAKEQAEALRIKKEQDLANAKLRAEEAARLKAEADKARAEALANATTEAQRKAQAKAEADRIAREKAEAERIRLANEKAAADAQAKAEEAARLKAAADKAKADAAAQAKAEADRIAREKAEADRLAKEKAAADAQAKAEEAARLKAAADKAKADAAAQAKAEADRIAREKAEADRLAKEKAAADAQAKAEEAARLKAETDKAKADAAAQAKAEADRIAREKAEADRLAKEKAAADAQAKAEEAAR